MHARLGFEGARGGSLMAIGIDQRGESYGLLVDAVGEVLRLSGSSREQTPVNLDANLARVASGIHRLDDALLVVLDADRVLELDDRMLAA